VSNLPDYALFDDKIVTLKTDLRMFLKEVAFVVTPLYYINKYNFFVCLLFDFARGQHIW